MPPKGRTVQEKNFAQTVVGELTSADNRQVLTAVGLFVVSLILLFVEGGGWWDWRPEGGGGWERRVRLETARF